MQYVFDKWDKIKDSVEKKKHVLLILNCDELFVLPSKKNSGSKLDKKTKARIKRLADSCFFTLAIISARPLTELKRSSGIKKLYYLGRHGLQVEYSKIKSVLAYVKDFIYSLQVDFECKFKNVRNISLSLDDFTLCIDFREVKEEYLDEVKDIICDVLEPLVIRGKLKISHSKDRITVSLAEGECRVRAINGAIENVAYANFDILPVYIGGSRDENIFEFINDNGGISIFAGENNEYSCARYCLKSYDDIGLFFRRIKRFFKQEDL